MYIQNSDQNIYFYEYEGFIRPWQIKNWALNINVNFVA